MLPETRSHLDTVLKMKGSHPSKVIDFGYKTETGVQLTESID